MGPSANDVHTEGGTGKGGLGPEEYEVREYARVQQRLAEVEVRDLVKFAPAL